MIVIDVCGSSVYASKKVYVDVVFQCMLVHVPLWRSVYARLRGCASPVYASVSGCSSPVYASVSGCPVQRMLVNVDVAFQCMLV